MHDEKLKKKIYIYIYVRTYVCMYVYMYALCMYVRMHACIYVRMYVCKCVYMYVCMYVCMDVPYLCIYLSVCPFIHSSLSFSLSLSLSFHVCLYIFLSNIRLLVCHSVILSVSLLVTYQCGPNSEVVLLSSISKRPIALPILLLTMQQDTLLVQRFLNLLLFNGPL